MNAPLRDRYLTFDGLDCDRNAQALVALVRGHVENPQRSGRWGDYFAKKLEEQKRLGVDDLFLVGSQLNNLYALFESCGDQEAGELLYQVEQECC